MLTLSAPSSLFPVSNAPPAPTPFGRGGLLQRLAPLAPAAPIFVRPGPTQPVVCPNGYRPTKLGCVPLPSPSAPSTPATSDPTGGGSPGTQMSIACPDGTMVPVGSTCPAAAPPADPFPQDGTGASPGMQLTPTDQPPLNQPDPAAPYATDAAQAPQMPWLWIGGAALAGGLLIALLRR